jgi:hypothetical protein
MSCLKVRSRLCPSAVLAAVGVVGCVVAAASACGPFSPNSVLNQPDQTATRRLLSGSTAL